MPTEYIPPRMKGVAGVVVGFCLIAACSSGGTKTSASTSSGSNGNGSQAASGATLPAADPSLSAFRLLDNAG